MLPVAILAGGLATRLRPVTEKIPKALVEIGGRPFIVHQLELLKRNSIREVVLCVGYLGEMVRDALGNGDKMGLQIEYSYDGPVLLGTGGSLKKALPMLGSAFFVLYGDSYLDCDYSDIQRKFEVSGKPALMTVLHNRDRWDRSNIVYHNDNIVKYDKKDITPDMEYIDYGLSLLKREVFEERREGEAFDLAELYKDLISRGEMAGYEVRERFYEIGSHEGLEETRIFFENGKKGRNKVGYRDYIDMYLSEVVTIANSINRDAVEKAVKVLLDTREKKGRLFILGVGGGAGNAAHAVNDFRKIAGIESYAPTDNVSELTARVNDDGWETVFVNWLKGSRLTANDCIFVFSVGGGNAEKNISANLVHALKYARETGASIIGVVGRDGGYTAKVADACVLVPTVNNETVTPHTEAFQGVIWHLVVSHPALKAYEMKWESVK